MEVKQYAEDALTINLGSKVDEKINRQLVQLKAAVTELELEGITDIVLSYTSLIIYFDVLKADSNKITAALKTLDLAELKDMEYAYKVVKIPVCYGGEFGPDIERFKENGLTPEEVINMHSDTEYLVYCSDLCLVFRFSEDLMRNCLKRDWSRRELIFRRVLSVSADSRPACIHLILRAAGIFLAEHPCHCMTAAGKMRFCMKPATELFIR